MLTFKPLTKISTFLHKKSNNRPTMNIKIKFSSNYKRNKMTSDALNDMRKVKLQVNNIFYDLYYNLLSLHKFSTFFNEKKIQY